MMAFGKSVLFLLVAFLVNAHARPATNYALRASPEVDLAIIGGTNAAVGAWPWQLSQQRLGSTWSHSCGASLISTRYALSAAHCVDGASVSSLRIVAGQHDRNSYTGTQVVGVTSYKKHEQYNVGAGTIANDIAIIRFAQTVTIGGRVSVATLPPDNANTFAGQNCVITGWGRTSSSNALPAILQQANITPITQSDCQSRIGRIGTIWDRHICVYDSARQRGACNGDSGGPLNCPRPGGYYVSGVTSWVVSSGGACQVTYPSVYTRTGSYLSWIKTNTP